MSIQSQLGRRSRRISLSRALFFLLLILFSATALEAETGFQSLKSGHLHFLYPDRYNYSANALVSEAPKLVAEVESALGTRLSAPVIIYIVPEDQQYRQLALRLGRVPEWSAGFASPAVSTIVLRSSTLVKGGPKKDLFTLFRHELAHILLYRDAGTEDRLPRWWNEGVSMLAAEEWDLGEIFSLARYLVTSGYIPLKELDRSFPRDSNRARLAYLESFCFVGHLRREYGSDVVPRVQAVLRENRSMNFSEAFELALGETWTAEEADWRRSIIWRYRWLPIITSSTTLWMAITSLLIVVVVRNRRRNRRIREQWDDEDGPPEEGWSSDDDTVH